MYNKVTKVNLLDEEWEVRMLPRVLHKGKRVHAGVCKEKKLILIATVDPDTHKAIPEEILQGRLVRTIVPIIVEIKKKQDGIQ